MDGIDAPGSARFGHPPRIGQTPHSRNQRTPSPISPQVRATPSKINAICGHWYIGFSGFAIKKQHGQRRGLARKPAGLPERDKRNPRNLRSLRTKTPVIRRALKKHSQKHEKTP
jgi:hypothetical protein